MPSFYLELYDKEIPEFFAGLPGAQIYKAGPGVFWGVLTTAPAPGSDAAAYIAPAGPGDGVAATTHGTDTLPAGTTVATLTSACIWRPKTPPYLWRVTAPDATQFTLDPPTGAGDDETAWHCVPPGVSSPFGIWIISVELKHATEIPAQFGDRNAYLNPALLDFGPTEFYRQPLLRLEIELASQPVCAQVGDITFMGCAPGTVQFTLAVDQPGEIEQIAWNFGDGSPQQTFPDPLAGTTVFDGLSPAHPYADAGTYAVSASVTRHPGCVPETVVPQSVIVFPCPADACAELTAVALLGGCAPGVVTLGATVTSPELAHSLVWHYGDGQIDSFDAGQLAAGSGLQVSHTYATEGPFTAYAQLRRAEGCEPEDQYLSVEVPSCPVPCPVLSGLTATGCAPGEVTFTADIDDPAGLLEIHYQFGDGTEAVFDGDQIASGQGLETTHTYAGSGPFTAVVTVARDDACGSITLAADVQVMPCDEQCASIRSLVARGCAPGPVTLRLDLEHAEDAQELTWHFGDGEEATFGASQLAAGGGLQLVHEYGDRCPYEASVTLVRHRSCEPQALTEQVSIPCCCPADVAIVVSRDGTPINPAVCVQAGAYTVAAVGSGLGDSDLQWTRDGQSLGNGTEAGFEFAPDEIGNDCGGAPATTVILEVTPRNPDCEPIRRSVTLTACRNVVVERCIPCWLLKLGMLLALGLFTVMLAIFMCPAILIIPDWLPLAPQIKAAWVVFAALVVSAAPWVALLAAGIGVLLFGLWAHFCRPTWCEDWLVVLWQALLITGFVFLYFALCPACIWLGIFGVPLVGAGIAAFFWWLLACRPSLCKIFFELMNLSVVESVIGVLKIVLAACIWAYGAPLLFVLVALLDLVAWIGVVAVCFAAPPRRQGG